MKEKHEISKINGKVSRKSKNTKEKINYKKKIKKLLLSKKLDDIVDETDYDNFDYADYSSDKFVEDQSLYLESNGNFPIVKNEGKKSAENTKLNKKKYVKSKETPEDETEMVNVIKNIVSSKISDILLPKTEKENALVAPEKNTLKKSIRETVNETNVNSDKEVFDPNKSLAQKILAKIHVKTSKSLVKAVRIPSVIFPKLDDMNTDTKSRKKVGKCPKILNNVPVRLSKKLSDKISYKHSVLEVFSAPETSNSLLSSANIASVDLRLKGKELQDMEESEELPPVDTSSDEVPENLEIDMENPIQDMSQDIEEPNQQNYTLIVLPKACILIMKPNSKVYFCGKVRATLMRGSVEILGHKLTSLTQDIYSLPVSTLLCFESNAELDKPASASQFRDMGLLSSKVKEIMEALSNDDSVILLQPFNNLMSDFINKNLNFNLFTKDKVDESSVDKGVFEILHTHFFTDLRKGLFSSNFYWKLISNTILTENEFNSSNRNVTMICGGKNAGKSTLLRYLVNRVTVSGPVLIVDLDPGQPEFTVCGLISATIVKDPLLGPNFTHLKQPERSLCLGLLNVMENEERYLSCVQDLFYYCTAHGKYSNIPWIINTMGFTDSMGLKIITVIMNIIHPTLVVEIKSSVKRSNFDMNLTPENINAYQKDLNICVNNSNLENYIHTYIYYNFEPYQNGYSRNKSTVCRNIEPKDERFFNMMAYFSQMVQRETLSIMDTIPYEVSIDDIYLAFNSSVCETDVYSIINGKMVALCHDDNLLTHLDKKVVPIGLFPCYGYGIVRGIDIVERKIYLITPVSADLMSFVNTLVYGEAIPNCHTLSVIDLPAGTFIPYTTAISDASSDKHFMRAPKRKFNPFRLLQLKTQN